MSPSPIATVVLVLVVIGFCGRLITHGDALRALRKEGGLTRGPVLAIGVAVLLRPHSPTQWLGGRAWPNSWALGSTTPGTSDATR